MNKRLKSLDVLRGLTVALMILVNNGAGDEIFSVLQHSKWNGITPCDLVFPFFLYMMGVSTYLSLKKTNFAPSMAIFRKIAKRTFLLFFIGLAINWFDMACGGNPLDFAHLRIWGVMQRIALCYGVVSVLAITIKHRYFVPVIVALLTGYSVILIVGNGYAYDANVNWLAQVDLHLFGYDHLYHKSPVDPEGLVSTIGSIAHTMIGFWCCKLIQQDGQTFKEKKDALWMIGGLLLLVGWLLEQCGMEPNKRIWTPSYVCYTCAFASFLLSVMISLIDRELVRYGESWFTKGCLIFGVNPLFLYVASEALAIIFGATGFKEWVFYGIHSIITNGYWASLCYSILFVALHAAMGAWLYSRKIYIKI